MLRLDDLTRGASGPTAEPQEGGASNDDTLLRTGRSATVFRVSSVTGSTITLGSAKVHFSDVNKTKFLRRRPK